MGGFLFVLMLTHFSSSANAASVAISPLDSAITDGAARLAPKPCSFSITGKWANATDLSISPIPLKANQPFKMFLNFTAVDDLWFGNVRGNITRLENKWVYTFDVSVCGSKGICPIRKGETRVYNETYPPPSTFVPKGTYRLWAEVVNQDGEVILGVTFHDCPL